MIHDGEFGLSSTAGRRATQFEEGDSERGDRWRLSGAMVGANSVWFVGIGAGWQWLSSSRQSSASHH